MEPLGGVDSIYLWVAAGPAGMLVVQSGCWSYNVVMSGVREHYEWDEVQGLLGDGDAPTPDDVSVTLDGLRLDSAEAVERFFEELRLEREAGRGSG